ncbi:MAG TPA: hypothetical protein VIV88_08550 [Gemmatimonadales bacterium]
MTMPASRAKQARAKRPRSRKASGIVALVEQLSSGLGTPDGAVLGRGLARLLADAYQARGRSLPAWVAELTAYYGNDRKS